MTDRQWYYVGLYGQIGPLSESQIEELAEVGVIERDTLVWSTGMADWSMAEATDPLRVHFLNKPPQVPEFVAPRKVRLRTHHPTTVALQASSKSRIVAGVLQLLIPGSGRLYLGYTALGIVQFWLFPCGMGIGWIWSVIDGLVMLTGGVTLDGYGRVLDDG